MRYWFILIFLVGVISAQARELNLGQALQMAEAHSFALQKARANASGATQDLQAARLDRLPVLSATGTAFYVSEVPKLNITIPPLSISRDVGTDHTYQTDFRLSVPLFTGGKISGGIDLASASADYYAAIESAGMDQTAFQTRVEYFNLQRADRQLQTAQASLSRAQVIVKDATSLYEAGAADSVNILDASLALARARFGVKAAESNRRASEIRLDYLLGLPVTENLTETDSLTLPDAPEQAPQVAATKPELVAADAGIKMNQTKVKLSKTDYFPTISAFGGYSYGYPNLDRFNNTWNGYFTFGANLNWSFNIGNKTGAKGRAAQWTLDAAKNDRKQLEENLNRDAEVYYEQLKLARERANSAADEVRISRSNYALAQAQHRDGVLASNRLVQIEADLTASEASLAASLADYYIAQSAYYYATGSENLRKGL